MKKNKKTISKKKKKIFGGDGGQAAIYDIMRFQDEQRKREKEMFRVIWDTHK